MLVSTGCLALLASVVILGSQDSSFIFNISTVVISDKVRESTNKDLLLSGHSMTSSNACLKTKNILGFFPFWFTPSMRTSHSFPGQGCIFCLTMSRSSLVFKYIYYYYILYKYFIKHYKLRPCPHLKGYSLQKVVFFATGSCNSHLQEWLLQN